MLINKRYFTRINLINLLIGLIPLSLIVGNLAININIILICLLGILIYKFDIFIIEKKKYQYLIYAFFSYLIVVTVISYLPLITNDISKMFPYHTSSKEDYIENTLKSFFFLRFLILFFLLNKLIENNQFNLKLFFISFAFFSAVVAIDIFIQVSFGRNLLGNTFDYRPTSFFGNESIAGGFLQKFSLFFIFLIAFYKISEKKKYFYIYISFLIFFMAIFFINNRMPVLLFIFSFYIFLLLNKNLKTIIFSSFLIISIFIISLEVNDKFKNSYLSFYGNAKQILLVAPKLFLSKNEKGDIWNNYIPENIKGPDGIPLCKNNINITCVPANDSELIHFGHGYTIIFNTGIQLWKENKIFGQGLKSFRVNCSRGKNTSCSTHPHNYFIEIMLDTGLIGLVLIYLIFFLLFSDFLKFYKNNLNLDSKLISLPFFLIIISEFFPLRSSGSFFSTGNATATFLILPIIIGLLNSKKFREEQTTISE